MKSAHKNYRRTWLNPEGAAFVITNVEGFRDKSDEGKEYCWIDSHVEIGDCSRRVSLEFYAHSKSDVAAGRRKWDTLIKSILKAREEWEAAVGKVFDIEPL